MPQRQRRRSLGDTFLRYRANGTLPCSMSWKTVPGSAVLPLKGAAICYSFPGSAFIVPGLVLVGRGIGFLGAGGFAGRRSGFRTGGEGLTRLAGCTAGALGFRPRASGFRFL